MGHLAHVTKQIRRHQKFKPFGRARVRDKLGLAFKYSWRQVDSAQPGLFTQAGQLKLEAVEIILPVKRCPQQQYVPFVVPDWRIKLNQTTTTTTTIRTKKQELQVHNLLLYLATSKLRPDRIMCHCSLYEQWPSERRLDLSIVNERLPMFVAPETIRVLVAIDRRCRFR